MLVRAAQDRQGKLWCWV